MAKASTSAKPTKKKAPTEPVVSPTPPLGREILPIPDPQYVGLTTYDARDPNTKYPPITMLRPPTGRRTC